MPPTFFFIQPDIDRGRGRTRELIEEFVRSWREGSNEGANEIAAVVDLLSTPEELPSIFKFQRPEGSIHRFLIEFLNFLGEMPEVLPPSVEALKREKGWSIIPLHIGGVSSATAGLYAALIAAGVAGGEVVTTSLNSTSVINAILMAGARPRFVDIDPRTWCMDADACARAISKQTQAIIFTHVNQLADMRPFQELFRRRGLDIPFLQDASLAVGSTWQGMRPGTINVGERGLAVLSLTISKIISGLGGAVVVAQAPALVDQILGIAHQGVNFFNPEEVSSFGGNFKMNGIHAAIALEQLRRRRELFERSRRVRAWYEGNLAPLVERRRIVLQELGGEAVITHFGAVLPVARSIVAKKLLERFGIQTGFWHAHHVQPFYRNLFGRSRQKLPHTERIAPRLMFLPFNTAMQEEGVRFICGALAEVLCGKRAASSPGRAGRRPASPPRSKRPSPGRR